MVYWLTSMGKMNPKEDEILSSRMKKTGKDFSLQSVGRWCTSCSRQQWWNACSCPLFTSSIILIYVAPELKGCNYSMRKAAFKSIKLIFRFILCKNKEKKQTSAPLKDVYIPCVRVQHVFMQADMLRFHWELIQFHYSHLHKNCLHFLLRSYLFFCSIQQKLCVCDTTLH